MTYKTHTLTRNKSIAFFADEIEAQTIQAKRDGTLTTRYFTLDDTPPIPQEAKLATFDQIEQYCENEDIQLICCNFH